MKTRVAKAALRTTLHSLFHIVINKKVGSLEASSALLQQRTLQEVIPAHSNNSTRLLYTTVWILYTEKQFSILLLVGYYSIQFNLSEASFWNNDRPFVATSWC